MNPFAQATSLGYGQDEILDFLSKFSPKMGEKIKKALTLGYSAEEIMKFIGNGFDASTPSSKKKGPSYESTLRLMNEAKPESVKQSRALRESKEADVLSTVLDPGRMIGAGIGAAAGGLAGGPAGAVSGAIGGAAGYNDLMKKYEQHIHQGGSLSLQDWLKSLMKAGVTGAAATQVPKFLAALQAAGQGKEEPVQGEDLAEEISTPAPEVPTKDMGPQESFEIFEKAGIGKVFESISSQVDTPNQMVQALQKLYGNKWLKGLETQENRPALDIVSEAFEFVRAKGQSKAQPEEVAAVQEVEPAQILKTNVDQVVPEVEMPTEPVKKPTKAVFKEEGHPHLQNYLKGIGRINTEGKGKPVSGKELKALKSSNVRYADYDPETEKLQILFAPSGKKGAIYEYENVPKEDVEKLMAGAGKAKTTGANQFRAYFTGKNPSIGHALSNFIKETDKKGDPKYPVTRIPEERVKDKDLLKVRGADSVHKAIQYVEAFEDLTLKSQAKTRAEGLKLLDQSLKELPEGILDTFIFEVTKKMSKEVKESRAQGKVKRFKGGKEGYIKAQVKSKVEELKKRKKGKT